MITARRPWALLAVSLAAFMGYLDNNIVNVALPSIQRDLRLTTSGLEWVVSAYILAFAGLLLAGGRLADAFGRRLLFLAGLIVFTGASLVAGLSGSDVALVTARAVQGLGGAMLIPASLAIISHAYPDPRERNTAIGIWSGIGALGLGVGPVLGGLLSQHESWGWIFLINVPIGAITLLLGAWSVTESRESVRQRLDLPGLLASTLALTTLTWALIEGGQRGWTSSVILAAFAVAVVAGLVFAVIEQRSIDPMVDLSVFGIRAFSGGIGAIMLWAFGLFGIYFFTSLYMQGVLGFSPTKAGLAFLPLALCMVAGAIGSEKAAQLAGAARIVGLAMLLMALGIVIFSRLGANTSYLTLMPSFILLGLGAGLTTPLTASILAVMPTHQAGLASALFNASREIAGLLGITVIGAILTARQTSAAHAGAAPLDAFLSGYHFGLLVTAALLLLGAAVSWLALRDAASPTPESDAVSVVIG